MTEWYQILMVALTGLGVFIAAIFGGVEIYKTSKKHKEIMLREKIRHEEVMKQLGSQLKGNQLQHIDTILLYGNDKLSKEELKELKGTLPYFAKMNGNRYLKEQNMNFN